jgi:ankyrin repeat protein
MKLTNKTNALVYLRELYWSVCIKRAVKKQQWEHLVNLLNKKQKLSETCIGKTTGSKTGATLLHRAVSFYPPLDAVRKLCEHDPHMLCQSDIFGRRPLHEACRFHASHEVVDFLSSRQPEGIYQRDELGRTPLHYAMDTGFGYQPLKMDVILLLSIKAPGLLNQRDIRCADTPLTILRPRHSRREVAWLLRYLEPMAASYDVDALRPPTLQFMPQQHPQPQEQGLPTYASFKNSGGKPLDEGHRLQQNEE